MKTTKQERKQKRVLPFLYTVRFSLRLPCDCLSSQYSHLCSRFLQCVAARNLQTPRRQIPLKLAARPSCVIIMPARTLKPAKPSKNWTRNQKGFSNCCNVTSLLPIQVRKHQGGEYLFRPLALPNEDITFSCRMLSFAVQTPLRWNGVASF